VKLKAKLGNTVALFAAPAEEDEDLPELINDSPLSASQDLQT
jgi:hypothetical protein